MARPLRLVLSDTLYHVTARGNGHKALFRDDDDRRKYLSRLAHYQARDGFRLLAYCLTNNHIHLAIETAEVPLPKTMAGLQSSYTQAFNRRHRRVGHLFQGRYKAMVVDKKNYGQVLIRFIHQNPVEAGHARRDVEYEWSSARAWFRGRGPDWLDVAAGLRLFGPSPKRAAVEYRMLRADARGAQWDETPSVDQQVRGSDEFADVVQKRSREDRPRRRNVSIEFLARQVAREEGVRLADLKGPGRQRREGRARAIVAARALDVAGISVARTARFLGRDDSTMLRAIERLRAETRPRAK